MKVSIIKNHALNHMIGGMVFFFSLVSPPVHAQPPTPPAQVQSQLIDGVRVRLKSAYWDIPPIPYSPISYRGKGLVIEYEAEHAQNPFSGDMNNAITEVSIEGPEGQTVSSHRLDQRNRIFLSNINPHWPSLSLDFELQNSPGDQRLAQGRTNSESTFHNLPFPRELDQTIILDQTRTTDWGTRITLHKVALQAASKNDKNPTYTFTFLFEAKPQAGDLAINFWRSHVNFMDLQGRDLDGLWLRRKPLNDQTHPATRLQQQWELSIPQSNFADRDIPNGLGLRLRLEEWSPRRQQIQDFKQFHFELPLAGLPDNTPVYSQSAMGELQTETVHLTAETWPTEQQGAATLRLWTRPTDGKSPNGWLIKSIEAPERRQRLSRLKPPFYQPGRAGWKSTGPALPNENSFDFFWLLETPEEHKKRPSGQSLKIALEEVHHSAYQFDVPNIPRPQENATLTLNRPAVSSSKAQLSVLAVGNYHDGQLPPNWPVTASPQAMPPVPTTAVPYLRPSHGIVVACRWTPAGGTNTVQATHHITAHDQQGRVLLDQPLDFLLPTAPGKWPIDEFMQTVEMEPGGGKEQYDFTLYLLPPANDVTSFNLQLSSQETITTGREQSVIFPFLSQNLQSR